MRRCVVIPAWAPDDIRELVALQADDLIVCADGGYTAAQRAGVAPHALIGDFDSLDSIPAGLPEGVEVIRVPREKNETDTFLCLQYGLSAGCKQFLLAGGIGGRLDHTVAHLQLLVYLLQKEAQGFIISHDNRVTAMGPGEMRIPKEQGFKLSVLAYSERCEGVTLAHVKYPLRDAVLTNDFPLGISNEFDGPEAVITLGKGTLLLLLSRDPAA